MKIVYVAQYYPPHTGGLEQVAKKLAQSAVQRGHAVSVVTFALSNTTRGDRDEGGVRVRRVFGVHFFDRYFGIPFCFGGYGLFRTLQEEVRHADLVHIHDVFYPTSWLAFFFSRLYRKPFVLTQHVALVAHTSRMVMWVQGVVYALFGDAMFARSKNIFVYNPIVRDYLLKRGVQKEKIVEVRNGVDITLFTPLRDTKEIQRRRALLGLPADKPLVLFVGRLVPKKGYLKLFEAKDPLYNIVFVGPGNVPESWHTTPGVHVLGEKTQEELVSLYPVVDVFVSPTNGELFTLAMQEAFACGIPVVTTDESEYAEYDIDRNMVCFCKPTGDELRRSITKILEDSARREGMRTYSRVLAERLFDWRKEYDAVIDTCERVVEKEKLVVVTTSWDDGHALDTKLAGLLQTYGIKGTFYVAPKDHEKESRNRLCDDALRELAKFHEVGAHTLMHKSLTHLSLEDARHEITESKRYLEELLGEPVSSFCYPRGEYTAEHIRMVADAGYRRARTVRRFVFRPSEHGPYEMPTSVHAYDHWSDVWHIARFVRFNPFRFFTLYRNWDKLAIAMFEVVMREGGVFHLWGHSYELEEHEDWDRLERVLAYIGNRSAVCYVPNRDVL